MKRIILCADDYGQTKAISQAVINLLSKDRLTAVSCMANSSYWLSHAAWLLTFKNKIDIGLHFNLTEGIPSGNSAKSFVSLPRMLIKSHLRQLDRSFIRSELLAQLDRFDHAVGSLPDFIDGHQHIHQVPVIRDIVLEVYEEHLRPHGCYIRSIADPGFIFKIKSEAYAKKLIMHWSGAISFKKELLARNIPHNSSFSGIYSFNNEGGYASYFDRFLSEISDGGLLMCHPGLVNVDSDDIISASRGREYAFMVGDLFSLSCHRHVVKLVRFKEAYG